MRKINIQKVAFIYPSLVTDTSLIERLRVLIQMLELRPKLGLAYLSAALKKKNIESRIYDQSLIDFNPEKLANALQKDRIDLAGIYVCSDNLKNAVHFIREIKKRLDIPVIAGGPGYIHYRELFQAGCEIVCCGEGDETIIDIADYYQGRKKIEDLNGIAYREEHSREAKVNPMRPLIDDLNELPFPLRDQKSVKSYCDHLAYPLKKPYISIACSRGCPYSCAYCTSHKFWRQRCRQRSVENVIAEIKDAVNRLGIKSVYFIDDVFAISFNWLREFCGALKGEKFDLIWACNLHPLTFKDGKEEAFSMMADSGCKLISFGAQSANGDVLRNINRQPSETEELSRSIYLAKKMNMASAVNYIFGLPGDTYATLQQNLKFCIETKPHLVDFHPLNILPDSEIALKYNGSPFCELDEREIKRISQEYMKKYYTRPEIISQLCKDIFNKNPKWFVTIMPVLPKFIGKWLFNF